jgi:DNA-binding NarL/FixJ family response regulator
MTSREDLFMEDRRRALRGYWGLPARRLLVFIHPFEKVADCFVHALEQEYPSLSVESFVGWHSVPSRFEPQIALTLIDSRLWEDAERGLDALRLSQPNLPYAAVCDDLRHVSTTQAEFMPADAMRGLLPMNMKLDLWLSIIGLMLQGGDYYPPSLLKALMTHERSARPALSLAMHVPQGRSAHWKELTERERQVLASVSRGTPNKLVAVELGLSEHTVKIHIHNIIRKLQVHNRTEAAALYLQALAQGKLQP